MSVKWFGKPWGAPVCGDAQRVPTPEVKCAHCGRDIRHGDNGLLLPYMAAIGKGGLADNMVAMVQDGGFSVPHAAYHLACFFDEIGITDARALRDETN